MALPADNHEFSFMQAPDQAEVLVGYKGLELTKSYDELVLTSPQQGTPWAPAQALHAHCMHDSASRLTCNCGVNAYKEIDALARSEYGSASVYAELAMWGEVQDCDWGYRSQYAYPKKLIVRKPITADELISLRHRYQVPVEFDFSELVPVKKQAAPSATAKVTGAPAPKPAIEAARKTAKIAAGIMVTLSLVMAAYLIYSFEGMRDTSAKTPSWQAHLADKMEDKERLPVNYEGTPSDKIGWILFAMLGPMAVGMCFMLYLDLVKHSRQGIGNDMTVFLLLFMLPFTIGFIMLLLPISYGEKVGGICCAEAEAFAEPDYYTKMFKKSFGHDASSTLKLRAGTKVPKSYVDQSGGYEDHWRPCAGVIAKCPKTHKLKGHEVAFITNNLKLGKKSNGCKTVEHGVKLSDAKVSYANVKACRQGDHVVFSWDPLDAKELTKNLTA